MILPAAQDRGLVVFWVWPSLSYGVRLWMSFVAMAFGLVSQIRSETVMPGIVLIAAATILLLVRGYDNRVDTRAFDPVAEWERVPVERLDELRGLHDRMQRWDTSILDVTNVLGATIFVGIVAILVAAAITSSGPPRILLIDAIVVLAPHWLTGFRRILTKPKLMIRVELFQGLLRRYAGVLAEHRVDVLMLLTEHGSAARIPDDVKLKIDFADHHPDFLGLYAQVTLNEVNGASHPYFYIVLVARRGFGLERVRDTYDPPDNVTVEYDIQREVETVVIRQTTTKTSGYETSIDVVFNLFEEGLRVGEAAAKG